jgi:ADP-ribose pyrophosphatase
VRSGAVVGVLPIDLRLSEMVLIRQFRLAGHIALGKGTMMEIPAGRVGPLETTMEAAFRECYEETGARPSRLHRLFEIMPAPALSDECMTLYIGSIDCAEVKPCAGCEDENEMIKTVRVPLDAANTMLARGGLHNSALLIALQWLALNREKLPELLEIEND